MMGRVLNHLERALKQCQRNVGKYVDSRGSVEQSTTKTFGTKNGYWFLGSGDYGISVVDLEVVVGNK